MPLPTPDEISMEVPKERALPVHPWVAAYLTDFWQGMRKNIETSMMKKGRRDHVQISPAKPASVHNPT